MIKGVGIDIVEIDRIAKAINKNSKFLDRIFTESEKKYINKRNGNVNTIAGLFAAKEAISKALGSGIRNFKWTDLEVKHDSQGKPYPVLKGVAKDIAKKNRIERVYLSISHCNKTAVAYSIAEGFGSMKNRSAELNFLSQENKNDNLDSFTIINKELVENLIPKRNPISHKGTYGRIGVIAGSLGMTGAAYLTSQSCLRSGSGLVYSIIPKNLAHIMEIKTTEVITKPVEDEGKGHFTIKSIEGIKEIIKDLDVIALGPGLGVDEDRIRVVDEILRSTDIPIILDGDGINCVSKNTKVLMEGKSDVIITPHPGELARLLDKSVNEIQKDRIKSAKITSKMFGVITVLKGANTIICDKEGNIYINKTGNAGMATAGSGDVLTGVISSFVGQNTKITDSAIAGVYIHGLAGDLASFDKGEYGLIASDIVEQLPYAIRTLQGG